MLGQIMVPMLVRVILLYKSGLGIFLSPLGARLELGKMTISDNYCFTKVVPYDDTNIWTLSPGVRMTPSTPR